MMRSAINVYSLIFTLTFILCQGSFCFLEAQAAWPTQEWERSTPVEQDINPDLLTQLIKEKTDNNKYEYLHSLIIIKNGYLVFEEYFNGFSAEKSNLIQSVTKSFTSAIIGMAIDQGHIKGVDERVLDFFPELVDIKNMDDRKRANKQNTGQSAQTSCICMLWPCVFTALVFLLCPLSAHAQYTPSQDKLFSPSVAKRFYEIAYELAKPEDASGSEIEQAMALMNATSVLDDRTDYILPDMIRLVSLSAKIRTRQ